MTINFLQQTNDTPPNLSNKDWVYGTILGDSYIDLKGRLNIAHSAKQSESQASFSNVYHKFYKLQQISAVGPKTNPTSYSKKDLRTQNTYDSISFWSLVPPLFKEERLLFYPQDTKQKKNSPKYFFSYFLWTPESLAFWFMDDGGRNSGKDIKSRGMVIDVSSFVPLDFNYF